VFSETLDSASATNKNNYALSPSITIVSASLGADQKTVTLTTSAIAANTKYKLTVSNVAALSGNTSPTGLQAYFTAGTTGTGLLGQYYDNIDFTSLKVTRTDATVNFNFGSGSPDPSIGADTFSVRWAGLVRPTTTAVYTFYTTSDDGVRLEISTTASMFSRVTSIKMAPSTPSTAPTSVCIFCNTRTWQATTRCSTRSAKAPSREST
jgi:hypothetical protein